MVVGAGIAGVATTFFTLRHTDQTVLLLERDRVARGATGRNAGQLTTYFERPLCDIADEFGVQPAVQAQRQIEGAHELLDLMAQESGAAVRIERFAGHMGMFNLQQLEVHLRNSLIRRQAGLSVPTCVVAQDAAFGGEIPSEFDGLYELVPRSGIHELLEVDDERYCAVLSGLSGCANSGLLAQQVLDYLLRRYPGRLRFADHTPVTTVVLSKDRARIRARGHDVDAAHVVLCTNGFVEHVVRDASGSPVSLAPDQEVTGLVGHMTAFVETAPRDPASLSFIRNTHIGGDTAYVYVTRRTYDRTADVVTLTCMGGPEFDCDPRAWDPTAPFEGEQLTVMDDEVRPFANPRRPPGQPYDFQWHGLMGYNDAGIRVVGAHPQYPRLLYNLACNGVGFLPSIFGGDRISRLLAGQKPAPSIFDPR